MKIQKLEKMPLSLKNSGGLSIFFVGVGSAFSKRHYQTNLLIIKGEDHLLVDCGTKTPQALHELGIPITEIKHFLITHSHADHIGGLEEAMLMNRYLTRTRPSIIINETYQDMLWTHSLAGGCGYNEEHDGKILTFGDYWHPIRPRWVSGYPRETLEVKSGSINIKMFRTMHIPDSTKHWNESFWSCGIVIDDRILFTSDTKYDPDLLTTYDKITNLEYIFHDCQFYTGGIHASLEELNQLPEKIKKKTFLTHYGDNWEKYQDKVEEYGFKGLVKQWHFYIFP